MDTTTALITRRSIRKYTSEKINNNDIQVMLKCGMYAPSAGNAQPWRFVVIDDINVMKKIKEFHPYAKMFDGASHGILVCADIENEKYKGRWPLDCSAATQNILLAAHELGIGSVWIGIYPEENRMSEITKICKLPANIKPVSLISLGYPAETRNAENRYDESRIFYNEWGNLAQNKS